MKLYGSHGGRHESIMMETKENELGLVMIGSLHFGMGKPFFSYIYMPHAFFAHFGYEIEKEFCFLHFYQTDIVKDLSIDAVDEHLNTVRFRWDIALAKRDAHSATRV